MPTHPLDLLRALAGTQDDVITARQALSAGLGRAAVASLERRGEWLRIMPGAYLVDAGLHTAVPLAARVRAALLLHGSTAVAVLDTAARLLGIEGLPPWDGRTVHIAVPTELARHQRRPSGVVAHFWKLTNAETSDLRGMPITSAQRTVTDLVLRLDRERAVSVLDSALNRKLILPADLPHLEASAAGRRGVRRSREWWTLADGRAESPLETRTRLVCVDGKVAPETLQHPVLDRFGTLLGHADLAWPRRRTLAETDGERYHSDPGAVYKDRWRANNFSTAAERFIVLRFTWADLRTPEYILSTIRLALAAAA